jgi:hypothetical protein
VCGVRSGSARGNCALGTPRSLTRGTVSASELRRNPLAPGTVKYESVRGPVSSNTVGVPQGTYFRPPGPVYCLGSDVCVAVRGSGGGRLLIFFINVLLGIRVDG